MTNDRSFVARWDAGLDSRLLLEEADREIERLTSKNASQAAELARCDNEIQVLRDENIKLRQLLGNAEQAIRQLSTPVEPCMPENR